jgi:peptidoglycan/LPS O-acetylase OafA/YrhL
MLLNGPILGDVCVGRNNNLNLIRMIAAIAVLVSHSWPISLGAGAVQPLERILMGSTLGSISVYVFFAISGFLIARSYERQASVIRWVRARVLRLFPALIVVLLLTVLVLGPLVTALPAGVYFTSPETLTYVPRNLSLAFLQYDLPGVFLDQPYPGAINGSLWTLVYEVLCYGGVLVAGLLGALRVRSRMALALAAYAAAYLLVFYVLEPEQVHPRIQSLLRLGLPFAIGTAFHVWRDRVRLSPAIIAVLVAAAALAHGTAAFHVTMVLALVWGVFVLGYMPGAFLHRYNRLGDYSYGVYIYAFPMQQLMVHLFAPMGPLVNMALALPATLALAVLSWVCVEKPALNLARGPRGGEGAPSPPRASVPPPA